MLSRFGYRESNLDAEALLAFSQKPALYRCPGCFQFAPRRVGFGELRKLALDSRLLQGMLMPQTGEMRADFGDVGVVYCGERVHFSGYDSKGLPSFEKD